MKTNDKPETNDELLKWFLDRDTQTYNARVGALRAMRKYVDEHYTKVHPQSQKLSDLQRFERNVKRWLLQIDSEFENGGNHYGKYNITDFKDPDFFDREQSEVQKLQKFFHLFLEALGLDIKRLEKQQASTHKKGIMAEPDIDLIDLIPDELNRSLLVSYEKNIPFLINNWKNQKDVELCAAFCNYLLGDKKCKDGKKMFNPLNAKSAITFARVHYNCKIKSSFEKLRKSKYDQLLKKKTDEIKRLILKTTYGTI